MVNKKKSYLIVGLGRFGISLCEKLVELGQSVIGVDSLPGPVMEVSDKIDVAAQIDVADESALIKVGAKEADVAIVTIGQSLESSILATSVLKDIGVPLLIARASTSLHAKILVRVGAHKIVFPEWDMGHKIAENLVFPWYSHFTKIGGDTFMLGKISPMPEMVGKNIAQLRFHQTYNAVVVMMEKDGKEMMPSPVTTIEESDRLWVLGNKENLDKLIEKTIDMDKVSLYSTH